MRLLADAAGRLRLERDTNGGRHVEVFRPDEDEADVEALAEGYADLFDPAPLLGIATFEILGE